MRYKQRLTTISVAALMLVSLCAVCATTSVTAQQPAPGLHSGTAVCSWGAGRIDVFAVGLGYTTTATLGYTLKHNWWDGAWKYYWEDLGAPPGPPGEAGLTSTPTAVSWGAGRIDVFATSTVRVGGLPFHNLWHKWFDKGWHGWENLGAPAPDNYIHYDTAPTVCSWGAGRLDVFIVGDDGQLWQKWFDNGWHDWVPLGKPSVGLAGSPSALSTVSWGYPRVDIFIRGGDGALWQLWWSDGWQAWHRFDDTAGLVAYAPYTIPELKLPPYSTWDYGYYYYAPAVCSWGKNRLDVFFVDTNGYLQQKYFDSGWKPLYNVGGAKVITAAPSAVTWQLGTTTRIDIFGRGDDFALWQLYFAGGWHGWYNLGMLY